MRLIESSRVVGPMVMKTDEEIAGGEEVVVAVTGCMKRCSSRLRLAFELD